MPRLIPLFSFLLLVSTSLSAAVEFRTLGWDGPISGLHYSSAGREIALDVADTVLSPSYHLQGDGPLELYRVATVNNQPARIPVASLPVPPGVTRALLILHMDKNGACSGRWLDDSPGVTPAGTMRVHNFSSHDLAINFGAETLPLARGAHVRESFPSDARFIPVRVAARLDDTWEYALGVSQPVRPRLRFVVLIRDARPTLEAPNARFDWVTFHEIPPSPSSPFFP